MTRHSSYSAPQGERPSGSYGGQRDRDNRRNIYNKRSWKDNETLFTLICFILPFIAIDLIILFLAVSTPEINYTISDTQDYETVDLSIRIRSLLPLKGIIMTLETKPMELVKEKGVYKTTLEDSGTLETQVTGWDRMTKRVYEHIATLGDTPLSIGEDDYVMKDEQLTVIASGNQSGVNYNAAYAMDEKEETIKPVSINRDTGEITFAMDASSLTVYVEDFTGNTLKASFTSHTEGIDASSHDSKFPSNGTNGTSDNGSFSDSNTDSSSTKETTKAKEAIKATRAAERTKETTKAVKTTGKAKETTRATKATKKATRVTKATGAANATKTTEASKSVKSTITPATSPATAPTTPVVSGPGENSPPTQAPTQASQAMPGGDPNDVIIMPTT